ncbi:MAG: cytochrome c [Opitutales bacterium]|nr:cytochrome c [Opitutales bacterium]NRA28426.1 hypothetical protein [Opitutales bacterium]
MIARRLLFFFVISITSIQLFGEEKDLIVTINEEKLTLSYEFVAGLEAKELNLHQPPYFNHAKLKVVPMEALWKSVAGAEEKDTLLAWCWDGYLSHFSRDFSKEKEAFIVVEINGVKPSNWKESFDVDPGPFFFSFDDQAHPGVLGSGHKMPWGVTEIEFVNYAERFEPYYSGKFTELSHQGEIGRKYWMVSCISCHSGPAGTIGGSRAMRPFEILAAHAIHNSEYFINYTINPQSFNPNSKMSAVTYFSEEQLTDLIAFMKEGMLGR